MNINGGFSLKLAFPLIVVIVTVLVSYYVHTSTVQSHEQTNIEQSSTLLTAPSLPVSNTSNYDFYFVMLAIKTCPHCVAMEKFFKNLPVDSYYCDIQQSKECSNAFWKLYDKGVTRGTPTILVCSKDGLLLVEVGEYQNETWWLSVPNNLEPLREGTIPVYITGKQRLQLTLTSDLYDVLCVKTLEGSRPIK